METLLSLPAAFMAEAAVAWLLYTGSLLSAWLPYPGAQITAYLVVMIFPLFSLCIYAGL